MVVFVNPHKVVVQRNAFPVLGNVQNDGVLQLRIESFGYARLKHSFLQVEEDLDYNKSFKLTPFPKKETTKKKAAIVTMKEEHEEGEKAKKARKYCGDGEVPCMIAL